MPARVRAAAVWGLALLVCDASVHSQKFSSRAIAVRVDVLVSDGHAPVSGLTARDFELRDNGVVQTLDLVDTGAASINAVLALDASASVAGKRQADLRRAAETLLDGLTAGDRAALTTFAQAVVPRVPLTEDLQSVRRALRDIEPEGRTALLDGVYVALTAALGQSGRFLVLACTDGTDTSSWLDLPGVLAVAQRTNAVVYGVTSAAVKRPTALRELADASGGHLLQVRSSGELEAAFQRILADFRSRYVLAYAPTGVDPDGYHRIEVTLPGRRLTVKARSGYVGSPVRGSAP